jgi:hypothetical protein
MRKADDDPMQPDRRTRGRRFISVLIMLFFGMFPAGLRADVVFKEKRYIGPWYFLASYDEDSGYGACDASLFVADGPSLHFSFSRMSGFDLQLGGSDLGWRFPAGKEYEASYVIDDQPEVSLRAWAYMDTDLSVGLGDDFSYTEPLRNGRSLTLRTPKGDFTFSLAGSSRALDAMEACAKRWLRFKDATTPATPSGSTVLTAEEKLELPQPLTSLTSGMDLYSSALVGYWRIEAMDGFEGDFSHCYMSNGPRNPLLTLDLNRNLIWSLEIYKEDWKLADDKSFKVAVALDDGDFASLQARTRSSTSLTVKLGKHPSILPNMKAAKKLRIRVNGEILDFDLAQFNILPAERAINAVERCATCYLTLEGSLPAGAPTLEALRSEAAPAGNTSPSLGDTAATDQAKSPAASASPKSRQYDFVEVGNWLVNALGTEQGFAACTAAGPQLPAGTRLVFVIDRSSAWRISLYNERWELRDGERYRLHYRLDTGEAIAVTGRAGPITVMIDLGTGSSAVAPFKRASRMEIRAAKETFSFDLAGIGAALDAADDCVARNSGRSDSARNPFAAETPDQAEPDPASDGPPSGQLAGQVEQAIATIKRMRLGRLILESDPTAETELRNRLKRKAGPNGDVIAIETLLAEGRAFLGARLDQAIKIAPSDVLAKLARNDRDVLRQLKSQPEVCAAFVRQAGAEDLDMLPATLRVSQGEIYADVFEAALARPMTTGTYSEDELADFMIEAYRRLGFPLEDIQPLDRINTLSPEETCRLGTQLMTALASLSDDKAGDLYRLAWVAAP